MKTNPFFFLAFVTLCFLSACTVRPTQYEYGQLGAYEQARARQESNDLITQSLFDSKDRTISEADIQRLLNGKIRIPDTVRLAVYKHASSSMNRYYSSWYSNEEYLKTQQSYIDTLIAQLKTAAKVQKVTVVPSLMTSVYPNITQLRESAVRLQADMLLVFSGLILSLL